MFNGSGDEAAIGADLRYFRDGALPSTTLAAAAPVTVAGLKRIASDIGANGDLAFTLGARADANNDGEGGYVRVWRVGRDR